jgi:hypothetical protein
MWIGNIYYALGLIPLLMTILVFLKLKEITKIQEWYLKFEKITQKKPIKSDFRSIDEYNIHIGIISIYTIDFIWVILGILTQNWYIFILIIILTLITNFTKKSVGLNLVSMALSGFILSIKFFVYLFLIINHFHLHYDIWKLLKNNI